MVEDIITSTITSIRALADPLSRALHQPRALLKDQSESGGLMVSDIQISAALPWRTRADAEQAYLEETADRYL